MILIYCWIINVGIIKKKTIFEMTANGHIDITRLTAGSKPRLDSKKVKYQQKTENISMIGYFVHKRHLN